MVHRKSGESSGDYCRNVNLQETPGKISEAMGYILGSYGGSFLRQFWNKRKQTNKHAHTHTKKKAFYLTFLMFCAISDCSLLEIKGHNTNKHKCQNRAVHYNLFHTVQLKNWKSGNGHN